MRLFRFFIRQEFDEMEVKPMNHILDPKCQRRPINLPSIASAELFVENSSAIVLMTWMGLNLCPFH